MRTTLALIVLAACVTIIFPAIASRPRQERGACCDVVLEALKASEQIKIGTTRREVEGRHFVHGGGAYFRDENTYLYSKCNYIAINIHFKLASPTNTATESPDDVVTKVSKPYLANPPRD